MSLAKVAVRQPIVANLLTVLVIGGGLFLYMFEVRKELFPPFSVGKISIQTVNEGAGAAEIEETLTIPIENEIARVDGVDEINSISTDFRSVVVADVDPDADISRVLVDLKAEADKARLPEGVEAPVVTEIKIPLPVLTVGVMLSAGRGTPLERERRLREAAKALERRLLRVPGVDSVTVAGTRDREVEVEVDPGRLRERELTLTQLVGAIQGADVNRTLGTLTRQRTEVLLRAGEPWDADTAPAELSRLIVRTGPAGTGVRLDALARVHGDFEKAQRRTLLAVPAPAGEPADPNWRATPAVSLTIFKRERADTIQLADRLRELLTGDAPAERLGLDPEVSLVVYNDFSVYIRNRVATVQNNGLIGLAIVLVVLFLFLNYRMAFMTALGIPVSLLGAMIVLFAVDYSANMLSLFALIVALGLVVDDAIIVCENAYRYIERGVAPARAAIIGSDEVMRPVIASVLTTVAAFLPLLLWGGITGKYMRVIPIVVVLALVISLIEVLTVLPSHIAEWSARYDPQARRWRRASTRIGRGFDALFHVAERGRRAFQRSFERWRAVYVYALKLALRWRYLVALGLVGLLVLAGVLVVQMDRIFFRVRQIDRFLVKVELPAGSRLEETQSVLKRVAADIRAVFPAEALAAVSLTAGEKMEADRSFQRSASVGQAMVEIIDSVDYEAHYGAPPPENYKARNSVEARIATLRRRVARIAGALVTVEILQGGPPAGQPLAIRLRGDNLDRLAAVAGDAVTALRDLPGVRGVTSDLERGTREFRVQVDADRARALDFSEATVASAVKRAFDGEIAITILDNDEEIDVRVRYDEPFRQAREQILNLTLTRPNGTRVPLKSLARLVPASGYAYRKRNGTTHDRSLSVTVSAGLEGISPAVANRAAMARLQPVLDRYPGVTAEFGGEFEEQQASFRSIALAFVLALLLIFAILATVLQSFTQPLIIMAAVPFGLVGAIVGLYLMGEALSVLALIGIVAMTGIVVNDSTVLVTFINQRRRSGSSRAFALLRAGRLRLRPILLTTITTIGGLATLSFEFLGAAGQETFLAPMGLAIIWGLTFGTGLTLIGVPCLYAIYEDILARLGVDPGRSVTRDIDAQLAEPLPAGLPGGSAGSPAFAFARELAGGDPLASAGALHASAGAPAGAPSAPDASIDTPPLGHLPEDLQPRVPGTPGLQGTRTLPPARERESTSYRTRTGKLPADPSRPGEP